MKRILVILAAAIALSFTACTGPGGGTSDPGPAVQITATYGTQKYLSKAKTEAAWEKRRDQLEAVANGVAALNEQGLSLAAVNALVAQFTDNPDVQFVVALISTYVPQDGGTAAPNHPLIKRVTDGIKAGLAFATWGGGKS